MSKQFEITRGSLMKFVKEVNDRTADEQLQGFNNTIRWHVGHVLSAGESFLFGFPKSSTHLPISYKEYFGGGSSPSKWTDEAPTLTLLIEQLEQQTKRIRELSPAFFEESIPFKFPFGNLETYGELMGFMLYHEADHLGQMKAMKRIIENQS
ncbi:DinB family protein [Bacillus sp. DJP31]|uniref:DinB family protein n=1 Tax=Bacillus sp. DJP31 TaxID=3409789 RepID=UPI003BB578DF